jgi:hypothetical protein
MTKPSRIVLVVGTALAAAVGGGAVALAAFSPVDGSGQINACYAQKNGALRVVVPGARCSNGESSLLWAQQGVPGPAGPAGPAGTLSCADELRIAAAAPAFAVTPSCAPTPTPTASTAAPALASITPAQPTLVPGALNVPVATVALTAPAAGDTTVQVTSASTGVVVVGSATVPSGQTSAAVLGSTLAAGTSVLTATLGTDTKSTTVTVVSP